MDDLPKLAIGLVTYRRTTEALRTIFSTISKLGYPAENIGWYVADDGTEDPTHMERILAALSSQTLIGYHSERMRHKGQEGTHNAGLGWNRCLGNCHQFSDFVLFLEDDWDLDQPLDIVPYVKMLREREDVGACSFRILSAGADVHTVGYNGNMYLRYLRTTQYAYSGNPYLRHARYTRKYGVFAEDRSPGNIELHQDDQYRYDGKILRSEDDGPQIWRPADISIWGGWKHIGTDKTWS